MNVSTVLPRIFRRAVSFVLVCSVPMFANPHVFAQDTAESAIHSHTDRQMPERTSPHDHSKMEDQGHGDAEQSGHAMSGALGGHPMTRESSGTSWQPDSSPHEGIHAMYGDWMTMSHGFANLIYDHQGGPRGDTKTFVSSMLMMMGQRSSGESTLGLRGMVSADPLMGKNGYPLLLQTGESGDGVNPLVDRQHPHDLFMELAATYSRRLSGNSS